MATETLELGRILVDIPVEYNMIKELHIVDHANDYGCLSLSLILLSDEDESIGERLKGQTVRIFTPQGRAIFSGICSDAEIVRENQYMELRLEAKSHAWIMDRNPKSRTFQSTGKTLKEIADIVLAEYPVSLAIQKDLPISQMLSQQEETDWHFLKRIANQLGMMIFTNVKSSQLQINIGVVPFATESLAGELEDVYEEKDIAAFRNVKQNTKNDAASYEFLKMGGSIPKLYVGSGCLVTGQKTPMVVTKSEIFSERGLLLNNVLLTYVDGTVPAMEDGFVGRAGKENNAYTSVLTGKVLEVSGTDIKVAFDDGRGGVRWIPYTNALGNDIYAMPDVGDTVFCYYENSGEVVALGSKHMDTSYPDFGNPKERSLTAYNRMIKLKENGIDLTGCRTEYDGKGGNQVKITFSDTEGIDIAASDEITIKAEKTVLIQAKEVEYSEKEPTKWFDEQFKENMGKFKEQQQVGGKEYVDHSGKNQFYNANLDLLCTVGGNIVNGVANDLLSPFQLIQELSGLGKKEDAEKPLIQFESVEDKRVSITALENCYLSVGDSCMEFGKGYIMIDSPKFQQSGFNRQNGYPVVSESQRTGMDIFMDVVQLGIDIASIFCPAVYGLKLISAGMSLLKGDYYGAISGLLPFSSVGKLMDTAADTLKHTNKITEIISILKSGADIALAAKGGITGFFGMADNFREKGWGAFTDPETWENFLQMGPAFNMAANAGKNYYDKKHKPQTQDAPDGDSNKPENSKDSDPDNNKKNQNETPADDTRKENTTDCGDPIDMVTGSQKVEQTELIIKDVMGDFAIRRYYESIYKNSNSMLGERWFISIGSYLSLKDEKAVILLPNRHLERFERQQDGSFRNMRGGDESVTLMEKNNEYAFYQVREGKTYWYDFSGKLVRMEDRNRNVIQLKYMGSILTEMDFPSGQVLTFHYENNKLSCITDILGRTVRYEYEGELLTGVTYPNGGTITYEYTGEGYLTDITDQNGNRYVHNEYAPDGRVTRQIVNGEAEYVILYDDNNRKNTFLNLTNNDRIEFYYNQDKLVVKTVYSDGSSEEVHYDEKENKAWEKDRRGNELHRVFNEESQILEERLPNQLVINYEYNEQKRLCREWDNAGRQMWQKYDEKGNITAISRKVKDDVTQTVEFVYDSMGRMVESIDGNGNKTRYSYQDSCPSPSSVTTPEGSTFIYVYDKAGRCMEIVSEQGTTCYAYNNMDYQTMITNPLGETTRYYYDGLCNLTKIVRANETANGGNRGVQYIYDALDAVIKVEDELGNVHATPRDMEGNIVKEIHPNTYDAVTGDGAGIAYEYDVFNHRTRIFYPDGGTERIKYDEAGNIIKKIAPLQYDAASDDGDGWNYEYDEVNRLVQITDPDGIVQKRYVYDLHGNIVKLIQAKGYLMGETDEERVGELYRYNDLGWLVESRKPVKAEGTTVWYQLIQYAYDPAGNMIKELRYRDYQTATSEKGVIHTIGYEYDKNNRLIRVSDCTGAVVEYRYNGINRRISEKRRINDTTEQMLVYEYDAAGRLTEIRQSADEEGCGRKTTAMQYEYDHNGNLVRIRFPYGAEVRREYDAADRLVAETHIEKSTGIHNTTRFVYDKAGNLVEIIDNQGRKIKSEYDLMNQEIRRTERDGGITRNSYDNNGNLHKVIRPNEYSRQGENATGICYEYDVCGRLVRIIREDGIIDTINRYDAGGLLTSQMDAAGSEIRYLYDLGGRRIKAETGGNSSQQYEYDAFGNITGIVDGEENRTQYILDEWGRIVEVKRADGESEFYSYDYAGNMIKTVDAEGHETRYEYNCTGQVSKRTDAMGNSEYYYYDNGHRLKKKIDRNGVQTTYDYNLYGNLLNRRAGELFEKYEYTPEGLLKSAISQGMRYSYEYDDMDRIARKMASGRKLLSYEYDQNGNRIRQEDVTGKVTEYKYDSSGQISEVWDDGKLVAEYGYHPDGSIRTLKNGNLHTEYTYDADKNITSLKTTLGEEVLADNHYGYDHNGNRIRKN
ncbi:MAG: contractile injection system protein, VgrG/Pvc8 family, partial [Lachnospiraceae bacterium]